MFITYSPLSVSATVYIFFNYQMQCMQKQREILVSSSTLCSICMQLYGLIRHGARYPTSKHLAKWEQLRKSLPSKLPPPEAPIENEVDPEFTKFLRMWTNPLFQEVANGKVNATDLTEGGMREEYCLAQRFQQHLPKLFAPLYTRSSYDLYSTDLERTILR